MSFPSNLAFVSYLQYSPSGSGTRGEYSKIVRSAIKSDGFIWVRRADDSRHQTNAIDFYVKRLAKEIGKYPFLSNCFGPDVTLVPIPRSAPLSKGALWPTHRICRALRDQGLAGDVVPLLERHTPVQKSAYAQPGQRPGPQEHFDSTRVTPGTAILSGRKITLVDDFITRGSTFVGMVPHVQTEFRNYTIRCFSLVRTQSYGPVESTFAPVEGVISFDGFQLRRVP